MLDWFMFFIDVVSSIWKGVLFLCIFIGLLFAELYFYGLGDMWYGTGCFLLLCISYGVFRLFMKD